MKKYYQDKIKWIEEKIAFLEKLLCDEKKELEHCNKCLKEWTVNEKLEDYKKKLMEKMNNEE